MNMKVWVLSALTAAVALGMAGCNDDDNSTTTPPVVVEPTPEKISLSFLGRYETGVFAEGAAEIPAFDAASKRAFIVNAKKGMVDVLDLTDPSKPKLLGEIDTKTIMAGAVVNSVAVYNGIVAVAVQAPVKTDNGFAAFYKASDLSKISQVAVGALPDMITFSPDGKTVLVANEAEPSEDYKIDPEGSVSIINVSDITKPVAKVADFKAWVGKETELRAKGVRIFGPQANVAQDFEPEYITVSKDGKTAWVTLQENNALAKINIATAKVTDILQLGYKDHGLAANALDLSDLDNADESAGNINIKPWQGVRGQYMPDAIGNYQADGKTYLVTANEGDAREWFKDEEAYFKAEADGFVETFRVKHLVHKDGFDRRAGDDLPPQLRQLAKGAELNPAVFGYCGATADGKPGDCRADSKLGRLKISWTQGYQTNADGTPKLNARGNLVYDALYSFGGRSLSIWDDSGKLVWDSGDQLEKKVAELFPAHFNSDHEVSLFDDRSDDKGPEPEGIAIGSIGQKTFAFVGLERESGVMVYDITKPTAPVFVQYINERNFNVTEEESKTAKAKDLGPEGLVFVPADKSPNKQAMLIVGNEISGTTAIFQINQQFK